MFKRRVQVYLWVISCITAGLGLGLIIIPSTVVTIFFTASSPTVEFFVRIIGCTLLGYAGLNAFAAESHQQKVLEVAIWANLVTLLTATGLSIASYQSMATNQLVIIGQHAAFASGFLYCAFLLHKKSPR